MSCFRVFVNFCDSTLLAMATELEVLGLLEICFDFALKCLCLERRYDTSMCFMCSLKFWKRKVLH